MFIIINSKHKFSTELRIVNSFFFFFFRSEYADWRPEMGALLQPVPFPDEAFALKEVQQSILMCVINRLAKDTRCVVHRVLLPVRESRPGWIHIAAPSSPDCPDQGELFGEMVSNFFFYFFFFFFFKKRYYFFLS